MASHATEEDKIQTESNFEGYRKYGYQLSPQKCLGSPICNIGRPS